MFAKSSQLSSQSLKLFLFSILIGLAQAQWKPEVLELTGEFPEDKLYLEVNSVTGRIDLLVEENLNGEQPQKHSLARLALNDPDGVAIQIISDYGDLLVEKVDVGGVIEWHLRTEKFFDYELTPGEIPVILVANGNQRRTFFIQVLDVNDNEPRITGRDPPRTSPIEELANPPSTPIFRVLAEDLDSYDNDRLEYSLEENNGPSEFFRIDPDTGEVFQTKPLDYFEQSSHRLEIKVKEPREPFREDSDSITISVTDVPNLPPVFNRDPIIIPAFDEEQEVTDLIEIYRVEARDGDTQVNWDIIFSLTDPLDLLKIDERTGVITMKRRIDAESDELKNVGLTYKITIKAIEVVPEGWPGEPEPEETEAVVDITIRDINDEPPKLCKEIDPEPRPQFVRRALECLEERSYSFSILETDLGQIVLGEDINVVDADSTTLFNSFNVDFAPNTPPFIRDAFLISPSTGGSGSEIFTLSVKSSDAIDFENGNWHDPNDPNKEPIDVEFTIEFIGRNDSSHKASAKFTAKVEDVNDNLPQFEQSEYSFVVCENNEDGTPVFNILPEDDNAEACSGTQDGEQIRVFAEDNDASPGFGQESVVYEWSNSGRQPPIAVHPKTGLMTFRSENSLPFDYERLQDEHFVILAKDLEGVDGANSANAYIHFKILDKNDVNVELKLEKLREAINETEGEEGDLVLGGITATDVDVTANIYLELEYVFPDSFSQNLTEKVGNWFKLVVTSGGGTGEVKAEIQLGSEPTDREGYDEEEIDRVDLVVKAQDMNGESEQISTQDITIIIQDVNDKAPEWPSDDENYDGKTLNVQEYENEEDNQTPGQREIQRFRVIDRDRGAQFDFRLEIRPENCWLDDDEECQKILDIFELANTNTLSGTTVLRRIENKMIDREDPIFFPNNEMDSVFNLTFIAMDGLPEHELVATIHVKVDDLNDNTPVFTEDYKIKSYQINESVLPDYLIETVLATDRDHPDRFGKVSYLIEDYREDPISNGNGKFLIGEDSGRLTPKADTEYNWFIVKAFKIQVKAIDDYTPSNPDKSRSDFTVLTVTVIDENDHAPDFLLKPEPGNPIKIIDEDKVIPNQPWTDAIIPVQDTDDPSLGHGLMAFRIQQVTKDPPQRPGEPDLITLFDLDVVDGDLAKNIKNLMLIPKIDMTGLWGTYTIKIYAEDSPDSYPQQLSSTQDYQIKINNVNLRPPVFISPPIGNNFVYILSITDTEINKQLINVTQDGLDPVPNVKALDDDKGSGDNGKVTYRLVDIEGNPEECEDLFGIDNVGDEDDREGMLIIKRRLGIEHQMKTCIVGFIASDLGVPQKDSEVNQLNFTLAWDVNSQPKFVGDKLVRIEMLENQTYPDPIPEVEVNYATDADIDPPGNPFRPNDKIYYMFKGGETELFEIKINEREIEGNLRQIPVITLKEGAILDREKKDEYNLTLYTTNDPNDPIGDVDPGDVENQGDQWLAITVKVIDIVDTAPVFNTTNPIVTGGFSELSRIDDATITIKIDDPDLDDELEVWISSEIKPSDPILPISPAPFLIHYPVDNDETKRLVEVKLRFEPKRTYQGFYEFQVTAKDKKELTGHVQMRTYMVMRNHVVTFSFYNTMDYIEAKKPTLAAILTKALTHRCNIDRVIPDMTNGQRTRQSTGVVRVETHFINMQINEPVSGSVIANARFDPDILGPLIDDLSSNGFILLGEEGIRGPEGEPEADTNSAEIVMYVLIGVVSVLAIALSILAVSCYFNTRSLSRRVRALTATTFGSQQSDLNRIGVQSAPNTNAFAVEGSNPIWTVEGEHRPAFDTESVGSGGSVLIGAEDEDYFQKSSKNPMAFTERDVVENYDSDEDGKYYSRGQPRNPLNLGGDTIKSIDVDAFDENEEIGMETDGTYGYEIATDNFTFK